MGDGVCVSGGGRGFVVSAGSYPVPGAGLCHSNVGYILKRDLKMCRTDLP